MAVGQKNVIFFSKKRTKNLSFLHKRVGVFLQCNATHCPSAGPEIFNTRASGLCVSTQNPECGSADLI